MGILGKAKEAITGGGSSDADEIAEEWSDTVDSQVEDNSDEMMEVDEDEWEEEETQEWSSAYKFSEDYLEARGFADMQDFINSCMAYKINQSPKYRDRLEHGVQTMNRVTTVTEQLKSLRGGDDRDMNLQDRADELKAANDVIDQVDKLNGKEDEIVNEALSIGRDIADGVISGRTGGGGGTNVESSVEHRDEEL